MCVCVCTYYLVQYLVRQGHISLELRCEARLILPADKIYSLVECLQLVKE